MRWIRLVALIAVTTAVSAQIIQIPAYVNPDVVDAASYTNGVAPGSVFIVKGYFPLPDGLKMSPLPLQDSLNGVSVVLTPAGGGGTIKAWMLYTYADFLQGILQIAAVLPSTTTPGNYDVSVISGSTTARGGKARVVERKYRSLANNQEGYGLAVIQNYVSATRVDRNMFVAGSLPDGQTKSPATPGQTVILWGLGLGAISRPDNEAPGAINLRGQLEVKVAVGGVEAAVLYAGRSPQFPGIDQINFTLPQNAPTGCNVALQVTVNGEASNPITIAVAPPGKDACEHPSLSREQLDSLDKDGAFMAGEFNLMVYVEEVSYQGGTPFAEIHSSIGYFGAMTASRAGIPDYRSMPPGQCTLWRGDGATLPWLDVGANDSYDGGMLTVTGPNLPDVRLDGDDDYYYRVFSARLEKEGTSLISGQSYLLSPAAYTLRGPGGGSIGPFEAALQLPEFLKWTNRDSTQEVNRNAGLQVTWTGGGSGDRVIIQGLSARVVGGTPDWPELDVASFVCAAPPAATSFTVPASILRSIPATINYGTESAGLLAVAIFSGDSTTRFNAPLKAGGQIGLGTFGYLMMTTKMLPYR